MGNEASAAMAVASAKGKFNNTMSQINESLEGQPKSENSGPASKKEMDERRTKRLEEYQAKQEASAERKSKLSQQWASHRQQNADPAPKKSFFSASDK